ncbi:TPA: ATP-binding cassette domain-containing protein [Streptococcus pneumoniae]
MVSAKRINQVLDLHSSIQNPVQVQLTDENFKGQVEFKDVTFRYAANSEAVIEHVSFKAETGQTVAFIGSTGSGKSTLVNLIPRFYDVSAGEILVDGVNVQDYDFSATAHAGQKVAIVGPTGAGKTTIVNLLMKFYEIDKGSIRIDGVDTKAMTRSEVHDAFSMVLQDTWLFEGTIRDNLIYNQIGISDERMMEASKAVGIHHFIMTLPDGYDTILDDTVTLSVRQKQLLTIARALLKDAPLLILDEATSSVDTRTEELIQKAMDRLMEGRTSFYLQLGLGQQVGVYVLIPASGFVALSLFRKKINHPRPYETWNICPLLDKDSSGRSMPSRHVFSATIISMACLHASLPIGLVCLIFSALLGLVRVLGGVHYPKDVLVGYACGLVWGFLFFLF